MHFFNPVHRMPLVEVIRGKKTSNEAIAPRSSYAEHDGQDADRRQQLPGLPGQPRAVPVLRRLSALLRDGADFQEIDKVMENFGWPMGPAYLQDVVGIDTAHHVGDVLAEGYPDRMKPDCKTRTHVLSKNKRFGQKNGVGFYKYETDPKGKPKKIADPTTYDLIKPVVGPRKDVRDEEIVDR